MWTGQHIELATNDETLACAGTRQYLDEFVGAVSDELLLEPGGELVRYYHLTPEEIEGVCQPGHRCSTSNHAFSDRAVDTHELLHATRGAALGRPLPGFTFFEEGLAVMYGWPIWDVDSGRDVYQGLDVGRGALPAELYGVAGHFMRYLDGTRGIEIAAGFVDELGDVRAVPELEIRFAEHFDESLAETVERYRVEYPDCSKDLRTRYVVECSRPPITPLDGQIEVEYDLSCDDPEVVGPMDDRMWRSFVFDVETAGSYYVTNIVMPFDFTMELMDCDRGCFSEVYVHTPGAGSIYANPDLEPGRYLVRLSRPVDEPGPVAINVAGF